MKLKPEDKILLLQYKLYFEELEVVRSLFEKGQADLLSHVTEFRESLSQDVTGQRENFNERFFGNKDIERDTKECFESQEISSPKTSEKNNKPDSWAKSLYKKIVFATHPIRFVSVVSHLSSS